jgi:hypothetical protein
MNACNTFESPDALTPRGIWLRPSTETKLTLPPLSVTSVHAKLA